MGAKARQGARPDAVLNLFHPAVSGWFRQALGKPTPAQERGWPLIAAGQNTLIAAPTGSGKTLAAFLAALDLLWKEPEASPGVRILYISPLKALNLDVARNLERPLEGIRSFAESLGDPLRLIRQAVRSGDSTPAERARIARNPPEILITTPESLHLLLTSRARTILKGVTHVILDEIHAICGDKRGVFTALLLERLQHQVGRSLVRIGLSATQSPLEEVARYLGGFERGSSGRWSARPVAIVDAGQHRVLDLEVIWPGLEPISATAQSVWPRIERILFDLVSSHRSTIIFANNRRLVERLTARLAEVEAFVERAPDGQNPDELNPDSPNTSGFRAHHGSISLEERRSTENALKSGELKAVVATASLELGIDMGAVDLVCQVESPGHFARAVQRVGRAGHAVGGVGKGRLIAKTPADLLELAALCRGMLAGEIERQTVPHGCLDVLAQQVLACVAIEPWDVSELYDLVRSAYSYVDLTAEGFESVLAMISGRFSGGALRDLRPRASWDRVHNRLVGLPGVLQAVLVGGGTIPDTGQFPVYLGDDGPRLGELDEEFVHERRVGDVFSLGSAGWMIEAIEPHRVIVRRAEGVSALTPFWRGEGTSRSAELGAAVGALARVIADRLDDPHLAAWLQRECRLEPNAADRLIRFIAAQKSASHVPTDRTVLVESFVDQSGELGLAVVTPYGRKLHHALAIALVSVLHDRLGVEPASLHANEGILFRLPRIDDPPLDLLDHLTAQDALDRIRRVLAETPLFGLKFRQNAARALLMPRPDPGKRTPLWLQRLRAKDLLQAVRGFPHHPIMVETGRQCLDEELDCARLRALLDGIQNGSIRVAQSDRETPSPVVAEMLLLFQSTFIYEWDEPRRALPSVSPIDQDLLDSLLRENRLQSWIDPEAVASLDDRLRGGGRPPRTIDEAFEHLRRLGDLAPNELPPGSESFWPALEADGRVGLIDLAGDPARRRLVAMEDAPFYAIAFGGGHAPGDLGESSLSVGEARRSIVERYLRTRALVALSDLVERYPLDVAEAGAILELLQEQGQWLRLGGSGSNALFAERDNLFALRRSTLSARRRNRQAVTPEIFVDFVARRQFLHPETRLASAAELDQVMDRLAGFAAPVTLWENEILPRRIDGLGHRPLDGLLAGGAWEWRARWGGGDELQVAFWRRHDPLAGQPDAGPDPAEPLSQDALLLHQVMADQGAFDPVDLARKTGLSPVRVRRALDVLMERGLATNDRLDPVRDGGDATLQALQQAASGRSGRTRRSNPRPEGRWSVPVGEPDPDQHLGAWVRTLLRRYGVLAREIALLEPFAPPWPRILAYLERAEWRDEVERGYFVEGLSGVQFAWTSAARELDDHAHAPSTNPPLVALTGRDPANLYGAGAPFDINLADSGQDRISRSAGTSLVLSTGRPVLIVEGHGKRVRSLPWAPPALIERALEFLPTFIGPGRRFLRLETYNNTHAALSEAAPTLTRIGFVRDYPAMTYYPVWGAQATLAASRTALTHRSPRRDPTDEA